jgi:hypothetical protein
VWVQEQFENFAKTVREPLKAVSGQQSSIVHFSGLNKVIFVLNRLKDTFRV